jgi:hypothetical protein
MTYILDLWRKSENRRKFFENYAHKRKFDPLVPELWYSELEGISTTEVTTTQLFLFKYQQFYLIQEVLAVLSYHRNSIQSALRDLFPNVGFDSTQFDIYQKSMIDLFGQFYCFYCIVQIEIDSL